MTATRHEVAVATRPRTSPLPRRTNTPTGWRTRRYHERFLQDLPAYERGSNLAEAEHDDDVAHHLRGRLP